MSRAVKELIDGPVTPGRGLGAGYLGFGGFVVALTPPGRPRMPNGVECGLTAAPGLPCWLGAGRLVVGSTSVTGGPSWDPVPEARVRLSIEPWFRPRVDRLAGRGAGLTPSGDDLLCGYLAGLVLWQGRPRQARALAEQAAGRTTLLSATLLRHAARGELPEPAHALLERGDAAPLRAFGHSSGSALLVGLALACAESAAVRARDQGPGASPPRQGGPGGIRLSALGAPGSFGPRGR